MFKLGRVTAAQQIIFATLIILLPSQLGYHIWLPSSYIQGIRVDYFAPTIYLTDVIILTLIGLFILEKFLARKPLFGKIPKTFALLFLGFALINVVFATSKELSLIKWIKVIELGLLAILIKNQKEIDLKRLFLKPILISGILIALIGIAQFISQSSLGGIFYFLGERTFNVQTPGIALANYFGNYLLRPYSTFSHPNSFAAFLAFLLISTYYFKEKNILDTVLKWVAFIVGLITLLLTHANWVFITLLIVFLGIYIKERRILDFRVLAKKALVILIAFSLLLSVGSDYILKNKYIFSESVSERMYLSKRAGEIVRISPLTGVGLNNFIFNLPKGGEFEFSWRLQPVHNIFLLMFVEGGILGVLFLGLIFSLGLKTKNSYLFWSLVLIVLSGLADHYWLTLQQNQIILSLVMGLAVRKYESF